MRGPEASIPTYLQEELKMPGSVPSILAEPLLLGEQITFFELHSRGGKGGDNRKPQDFTMDELIADLVIEYRTNGMSLIFATKKARNDFDTQFANKQIIQTNEGNEGELPRFRVVPETEDVREPHDTLTKNQRRRRKVGCTIATLAVLAGIGIPTGLEINSIFETRGSGSQHDFQQTSQVEENNQTQGTSGNQQQATPDSASTPEKNVGSPLDFLLIKVSEGSVTGKTYYMGKARRKITRGDITVFLFGDDKTSGLPDTHQVLGYTTNLQDQEILASSFKNDPSLVDQNTFFPNKKTNGVDKASYVVEWPTLETDAYVVGLFAVDGIGEQPSMSAYTLTPDPQNPHQMDQFINEVAQNHPELANAIRDPVSAGFQPTLSTDTILSNH